jgi:hypothetical protein
MAGCSLRDGGQPLVGSDKTKSTSRQQTVPVPLPIPKPIVGDKTDFVHDLRVIESPQIETIRFESLAWCEVAASPGGGETYCIEHEVAQLSQGKRTTYIVRSFDRVKEKAGFTSNLPAANVLWNTSDRDWKRMESIRENTPVDQRIFRVSLPEYREFLEAEHRLSTDRCRSVPEWQSIRDLTPTRQGNLTLWAYGLSAMDRRVPAIMTILEINLGSLELAAVDTIYFPTELNVDPQVNDLAYSEEAMSQLFEVRVYGSQDDDDVFQIGNPRRDTLVGRFLEACHESYFAVAFGTPTCRAEWRYYLPAYSPAVDERASKHFQINFANWKSRKNFGIYHGARSLSEVASVWRTIPDSLHSPVPQECLQARPRTYFVH